jgi:hypothetical protein
MAKVVLSSVIVNEAIYRSTLIVLGNIASKYPDFPKTAYVLTYPMQRCKTLVVPDAPWLPDVYDEYYKSLTAVPPNVAWREGATCIEAIDLL